MIKRMGLAVGMLLLSAWVVRAVGHGEPVAMSRPFAAFPDRLGDGSEFDQVLNLVTLAAPSFSLRGGTREILRGIIAKGLGLR